MIFDSHEPNNIPDVILQESLEDFVHDITSIHAFKNWEFQNTKGLLNILLELVQLYSNYQASLIQDVAHPQVKFEYDTSQEYQGVQFFVVDPSLMERSEIRCVVPLYFESQGRFFVVRIFLYVNDHLPLIRIPSFITRAVES